MGSTISWYLPLTCVIAAIFLLCLSYIIYQLFFHPLAKIPGPKLAALSTLFEGYIDISTQGRYLWRIEEWHKKYGPIVRIGPNEVHINDASFYEELYNGKFHLDKYEYYYKLMIFPSTTFGTLSAQVHQTRRKPLDPFFSPGAVAKIQPLLQQLVDRLCERISENISMGKPVPLFYAYRSLTVDLISEHAFGERLDILERADWGKSFYVAFRCVMEVIPFMRQFPFLSKVGMTLPRWMVGMIDRRLLEIIDLNSSIDTFTARTLELDSETIRAKDNPTVVWQLAYSSTLPEREKKFERIALEANSIVTGGMEAASATLTYTTFQILNTPGVHARLIKELQEAIPDSDHIPDYSMLRDLPYLTACIKEGLRLSFSAIGRLPRCSPSEPIEYGKYTIPPKAGIGMSQYFVHLDPQIFPSPHVYNPSRWLAADARSTIEPYLVPFSRGARMCIGMNVAYAELYTLLATMLRRFPTLTLFDTTERDVELVHDYFAGVSRHERGGLKVEVKTKGGQ